jgi:putative transposase
MPSGLRRFQQTRHSHFVTFSCYRRQPNFRSPEINDLFVQVLEDMHRLFSMGIYGYVVMPEYVHLLVSEPERGLVPQVRAPGLGANLGSQPVSEPRRALLDDAIHYLKLSFAKRLRSREGRVESGSFWQKRYYDRNVRDAREFSIKLRYVHRNPVKRGLVSDPADWKWSSFRHYSLREVSMVEIESEWTARDREIEAQGGPPRVFLNPPGSYPPASHTPDSYTPG